MSQLRDPDRYQPCDWDLRADAQGRTYWDALFRWHFDDVLMPLIQAEYGPTHEQLADFRRAYLAVFDELLAQPERYDRVDILLFTELRRQLGERYGFHDPFRGVKKRENDAALELLPGLLAELDAAPPQVQQNLLLCGLLAGNIFDLGARATVQSRHGESTAFRQVRDAQTDRCWLQNDAAAWWQRWGAGPYYRHVLFFVDNAGSDLVLGCLPLARWMVQAGARVTLAANTSPALNDITAAELGPLLGRAAELDAGLADAVRNGRLSGMATGGALPLLDLTQLATGFVSATADADLVILLGMGRAVESNFHAGFRCDAVWAALVKDEAVAARLGGALFDWVFRYERGSASPNRAASGRERSA